MTVLKIFMLGAGVLVLGTAMLAVFVAGVLAGGGRQWGSILGRTRLAVAGGSHNACANGLDFRRLKNLSEGRCTLVAAAL